MSPNGKAALIGFSLTYATGYATSSQVTGKLYAADMTSSPTPSNMTTAIADMQTAYTDAAGRTTPDKTNLGAGNIGGLTLVPGLYVWGSTVLIPANVTLAGAANDVWIFQMSGNLTLSSSVKVLLSGGAQAKNVFWQLAGIATLGTTSHFEGNILSKTQVVMQTGASMNGRALAQTQVTLDHNVVKKP